MKRRTAATVAGVVLLDPRGRSSQRTMQHTGSDPGRASWTLNDTRPQELHVVVSPVRSAITHAGDTTELLVDAPVAARISSSDLPQAQKGFSHACLDEAANCGLFFLPAVGRPDVDE